MSDKSSLSVPRAVNGVVDPRALSAFCQNVALRIAALEKALNLSTGQTTTQLLQNLNSQSDGLVYKRGGQLFTCTVAAGSGLEIALGTANPKLSAPLLASLEGQPDGLVVKSGDEFVTRILLVGSGTALTIDNPDGQAGDPTFHGP